MNHSWAASDMGYLGKFSSTRGNLYWRIVFWLFMECIFLGGFFYVVLIEPSAPSGSTLRSIVATVTPLLCLLCTVPVTFMLINCIRLIRPCEVIYIYKEGFAIKSRSGNLRSAYNWSEIEHMSGDTSYRNANLVAGTLVVTMVSILLIFFLPIALELGFTGRVLEIYTSDRQHYIIDRRFPKRRDLAILMKSTASFVTDDHVDSISKFKRFTSK